MPNVDTNIPFSREKWNEIIQQINDLAAECDVDPLEEVDECHKWSSQDIIDAQDKLREICEDNEFSPVEPCDKWLKDIVQELCDAIDAGACCDKCEDLYANGPLCIDESGGEGAPPDCLTDEHEGTAADPFPSSSAGVSFGVWDRCWDWRPALVGGDDPGITMVECFDSEGMSLGFIEMRTGGRGYVGRAFCRWEVSTWLDGFEPQGGDTFSGDVIDGYIQLPGFSVATQPTCDPFNPAYGGGTLPGDEDPGWPWGYSISSVETNSNPNPVVYTNAGGGTTNDFWFPLNRNFESDASWTGRVNDFVANIETEYTVTWNGGSASQTFPAELPAGFPAVPPGFLDANFWTYDLEGAINTFVVDTLTPLGVLCRPGSGGMGSFNPAYSLILFCCD